MNYNERGMEKLLVILKSWKQSTMVKSIYVGTYLNLHTYTLFICPYLNLHTYILLFKSQIYFTVYFVLTFQCM